MDDRAAESTPEEADGAGNGRPSESELAVLIALFGGYAASYVVFAIHVWIGFGLFLLVGLAALRLAGLPDRGGGSSGRGG